MCHEFAGLHTEMLALERVSVDFSEHQRLFLAVVCERFHESGEWPTCRMLDKALRRHADLDVEEMLKELDSFMHEGWHAPLSGWNPEQVIVMNVRALHVCQAEDVFPDLENDLVAFMALLQLAIERYETGDEDVVITAEEAYSRASALTHQSVDNGFELVCVENLCSQSGSGAHSWSFRVSDFIRKYRNVETLEDYLAVRRKLLTPKLVYTGHHQGVQPSDWLDRLASPYTFEEGDGAAYLVGTSNETQRPITSDSDPADAPQGDTSEDSVVPMELLQDTRGYIVKVAQQVNWTYNARCYDACAVMIRRLIETLIIEVFEARGIADRVKLPDGTNMQLGALINRTLSESSLSIGRNSLKELPRLKEITDKSAHDRRYNAVKSDIKGIRDAVRGIVQELIYLTGWK